MGFPQSFSKLSLSHMLGMADCPGDVGMGLDGGPRMTSRVRGGGERQAGQDRLSGWGSWRPCPHRQGPAPGCPRRALPLAVSGGPGITRPLLALWVPHTLHPGASPASPRSHPVLSTVSESEVGSAPHFRVWSWAGDETPHWESRFPPLGVPGRLWPRACPKGSLPQGHSCCCYGY